MIKTIQMLIIIVIIVIKSKQLNKFFDPSPPPMRKCRDREKWKIMTFKVATNVDAMECRPLV